MKSIKIVAGEIEEFELNNEIDITIDAMNDIYFDIDKGNFVFAMRLSNESFMKIYNKLKSKMKIGFKFNVGDIVYWFDRRKLKKGKIDRVQSNMNDIVYVSGETFLCEEILFSNKTEIFEYIEKQFEELQDV